MLLVLHTNDLFLVLKNITTERVPGIYIKRFLEGIVFPATVYLMDRGRLVKLDLMGNDVRNYKSCSTYQLEWMDIHFNHQDLVQSYEFSNT
ncbi:hypothetical protein [Shewanella glacialipiscicola]|jgi:hypothetical protein|uniref:hypothetical protein n=1 Tax=Shewanella glacialipiscicola TaxID=614069 RepID=UPI003D795454